MSAPEFQILDGGKAPVGLSLKERFFRHVSIAGDPDDPAAHWLWRGARHRLGYGIFMVAPHATNWAASRVAYVLQAAEPLLPSRVLTRTCGEANCVRHWALAKKTRKQPAHIPRYLPEDRELAVLFALDLGIPEAAKTLRIKKATLGKWCRDAVRKVQAARREQMNGATAPSGDMRHDNDNPPHTD